MNELVKKLPNYWATTSVTNYQLIKGNVKNIMKNHGFSLDDVLLTPHKPKIGKLLAMLVKHTNFLTIYSAKNIYIVQNQIFQ